MSHDDEELTFEEADRRYADLKRQHESGALSDEGFAAQLRYLMVQSDDGHWWSKSPTTGDWHYYDGEKWVKGTPPHYETSPPPPEEPTSTDVSPPERTDPPSSEDEARDDSLISTQTDRTDEEPSAVRTPPTEGTLRTHTEPTEQQPSQSPQPAEGTQRSWIQRHPYLFSLLVLFLLLIFLIVSAVGCYQLIGTSWSCDI